MNSPGEEGSVWLAGVDPSACGGSSSPQQPRWSETVNCCHTTLSYWCPGLLPDTSTLPPLNHVAIVVFKWELGHGGNCGSALAQSRVED